VKVVALLDSMWGARTGTAPRAFRINSYNFSGRRLYRLVGLGADLWVTNSCKELQTHATRHGTPDPAWVAENLRWLEPCALLLVCGRVAQQAYRQSGYAAKSQVLEIAHPAARTWTKETMDRIAEEIRSVLGG
jgi:hypothetical protein